MTPAEILRAAKAKIEDPKHWIQTVSAVTPSGRPVRPESPFACAWCAYGAVISASTDSDGPSRVEAQTTLDEAASEIVGHGWASYISLNDERNHATVMLMFDRAIELAEQEGADHDRP